MKRHPSLSDSLRLRRGRLLRRAARRALGLSVRGTRVSHRRRRASRDRRGSTMLVVLGLLGILMLLGMLYFTFATQEQQSATNFAEAAKRLDDPGDDIDAIFDSALRQLIRGAEYSEKNSAIWGPRHSLLGTLLGYDLQPYSGSGVNLIKLAGVGLVVDQNRDGIADVAQSGYDLRELNDSPAALHIWEDRNLNGVLDAGEDQNSNGRLDGAPSLFERTVMGMPAPDVDYTAADHNNVWLAYEGDTFDFSTTPPTKVHVVKPSFQRPELMRDGSFNPIADWYANTTTSARTFRPHPSHLYVWRQGQDTSLTPERRFLIPKDDTNGNGTLDAGEVDYNGNGSLDLNDDAMIAALPGLSGGFPFQVNIDGDGYSNEQGVWSRATGVPAAASNLFEYDVDTDGDGINDAIWMDLDLGLMVRSSDNATYVPLIAFKVVELDSRINVNIAGNLSGDTRNNATSNFGNGFFISQSSMGLSPAEINPGWALDAVPGAGATFDVNTTATPNPVADHIQYFGYSPTSQLDLGNMEWWWLNKGRIEYVTPRIIHPGRFGEANRLWQVLAAGGSAIGVQQTQSNLFPFAGVWDQDDNRNANDGGPQALFGLAAGQTLPFRHPLLQVGQGRFWNGPKQLNWHQPVGTNPNRWVRYDGAGLGDDGSGTGNVGWLAPFGGALMTNPRIGANFLNSLMPANNELVDDPLEMTLEPDSIQRTYEDPFDPVDTLALNMSKSDRDKTGITSRVHNLMPANTLPVAGGTQYQIEVAKRFTTGSWDLKTFANPRYIGGPGADGKPGIAGVDDNGDGIVDDANELGWPGSDDDRAWEFNADTDGDGLLEFPPEFTGAQAFSTNDPFRPQLRRLLTTEFGNMDQTQSPMRLSVNEFLDVEHRQGTASNPITSPLQYRPLTPHTTDVTLTTLPSATPLPAYPPTNEGEKEFWARRDRQQMARDIYVLLYTFCGGNDSVNVTATGFTAIPAPTRQKMAQFAVNLVDALDRDSVITMFEYDNDLSNGWGLDDDPTGPPGNDVAAFPERRVVFGVEAQELAFSEVHWMWQKGGTPNTFTPFDESIGDHHFTQIELRALSPLDVKLALPGISTTENTALWRIHRDDDGDGVVDQEDTNGDGVLDPGEDLPEPGTGMGNGILDHDNVVTLLAGTGSTPPLTLSPGDIYTMANADSTAVGSASLYVDHTGVNDYELVGPKTTGPALPNPVPGTPPAPVADLDLVHTNHASYFALATGLVGDFLDRKYYPGGGSAGAPPTRTTLRLERRLNPNCPQLPISANPWVSVDTFSAMPGDLKFEGDASLMPLPLPPVTTQAEAASRLSMTAPFDVGPNLRSQERTEPLNGGNTPQNSTGNGPLPLLSSIAQENSNSPAAFQLFQSHFDRDFASVVELFQVPLRGPALLTSVVSGARRPPSLDPGLGLGLGQLERGGPFTFGGAVLLQTEDANHDGALVPSEDTNGNGILDPGEDTNSDNRLDFGEDLNGNATLDSHPYHFHRLLSLMEVPTRTHRQLGDPLKIARVPGKINLNGVSDPHILAALIDDRQIISPPERDTNGNAVFDPTEDLDTFPNSQWDYGLRDVTNASAGNPAGDDPGRDWFFSFLAARDGIDPTSGLPLPIGGVSRPFRDLGLMQPSQTSAPAQSSVEDTLFRKLPNSANGRRLFELGNETDFTSGFVEPLLRDRILSKMIGNTTTRSNVFLVFATIGMFECVELPNGAVRIGGQMDVDGDGSKDTHRAVFMIDRSFALDAYDKGSRTFDWKKLVQARQRIN